MSHVKSIRLAVFTLSAAALLVAALPVPAEAQRAQRRSAVQRPPVSRPIYRPVVGYYNHPFYWRNMWWAGYGYPWGVPFGFGYPFPYGVYGVDITAAVRLQVTPRDAEVFVDGYSAGIVDDFDGVFQRLRLQPGGHEITVYLEGYRTFRRNIHLSPGATQTIRHELEPLSPDEAMEPPPEPRGDDGGPVPDTRGPGPDSRRPDPRFDPRPDPRSDPGYGQRQPDRPAAGRFGTLSIRVQPADAEIIVDGERWTAAADATRIAIQLPVGRHVVEVRKAGFAGYREDVLIRAGAATNLNVSLAE